MTKGPTDGKGATDWYKDAIIYQLHVKAFHDTNGDGVGDIAGLIEKLDYIQELGVTAVWLLPFYPSPLRDDGYDIADYTAINPTYGNMREFRTFIAEAHRRGLKVITELVINHTSDQHPWFQRARQAKPGSSARDFYVWSDDDRKFPETRIIFLDTEKSNWAWDPVAGAYYWHRFYSHQPDLNFDNPRVLHEVLRVMHFWLKAGVDGLRLDAIPYLVEREGTNNENLPETHVVLKKIRAELDRHYDDRMLLAEANQWPEDTQPYFGDGDECHMGFHFPLMPRMYMAVAQEDRHPITDIIRQTPEIPPTCQWGIFLRNHDELTLEMVTESERDYLWRTYAEDARARINLGIRRRLAPLMQNDRRKIELMNSMLLSMPGTPILYYGDEIGMGDNYYLGDRDGVRTPMQWSSDRNAGFSRANPQQLYLPVILDPVYGYQTINVESQSREQASLLNWTRRMIAVRKQHPAFGRGTMTLLYPRNRKVLAYVREFEGDRVLCVVNLSRAAQAAEIDLSQWRGHVPIELTGRSAFPPIGDLPYLVTLPAYGFYWFLLTEEAQAPAWHLTVPDVLPEFVTLPTRDGKIETALEGREGNLLQTEALPKFLQLQRWFAGQGDTLPAVRLKTLGALDDGRFVLAVAETILGGEQQDYLVPLAVAWGEDRLVFGSPTLSWTIARLRRGPRLGALLDAGTSPELAARLMDLMRGGARIPVPGGSLSFEAGSRLATITELPEPKLMGTEQSNSSLAFGDKAVLKVYRRIRPGTHPDVEVARFLTEVVGFEHIPAFLGLAVSESESGEQMQIASAFAFVPNQGDGWSFALDDLERGFERAFVHGDQQDDDHEHHLREDFGSLIGRRLAGLHAALATPTDDPAFSTEPVTAEDIAAWVDETATDLSEMHARLSSDRAGLTGTARDLADRVFASRGSIEARLQEFRTLPPVGIRTRIHGDLHLGQMLVARDDLVFIDFEGEPHRSIEERRRKTSPLRDVAGMIRSLDYAAASAVRGLQRVGSPDTGDAEAYAYEWRNRATRQLLDAYRETLPGTTSPGSDLVRSDALLELFLLQKAAYEVTYELGHRPDWVEIPLRGLLDLLGQREQ